MKKIVFIKLVLAIVATMVVNVSAGIQERILDTEIQKDCLVLQLCEQEFLKKKAEIEMAMGRGDNPEDFAILAQYFTSMTEGAAETVSDLNTKDQYFSYIALTLAVYGTSREGEKLPSDLTMFLAEIATKLSKKLEACNRELPIEMESSFSFFTEEPECCKAQREIKEFYETLGLKLDPVMKSEDPTIMVGYMVELAEYAKKEYLTGISRLYFNALIGQIGEIVNLILPGMIEQEKMAVIARGANQTVEDILQVMEECYCLEE